jgi:hypothetical protein
MALLAPSQPMKTLLTSPWFEIVHRAEGIVLLTRTDRVFESVVEIDRAHGEVQRMLDLLPRHRLGLVVDLRRARARNDPEFERAMEPHRKRMFEGFARRAIIVKSAVGRLHVQRHARQDGNTDLQVFLEAPSAIAFAGGA